ncbi:MAG: MarR family winged helix-turn-helix transcriptional regulator [Lachnospiraceae bacterium]
MEEKQYSNSKFREDHYSRADTNGRLVINLRNIGHILRFLSEGKGSQKRILILLNETGTITQQTLTEILGIQPGSVSEVIGKLESAELIARTPSETDRRTTDIVLTEKGKEQALEVTEQRKQRYGEMFSCLSEQEKTEFLKLLEKVNGDWKQRYQHGENEQCGNKHGKHGDSHSLYGK